MRLRVGVLLLVVAFLSACGAEQEKRHEKPNIVLIVADDLAYTDLGAFGGEIATPNLDALALSGMRLTQFYATPACSPTRAALLSGVDHHLAGLGTMAGDWDPLQKDQPGYEGYLNFRVASVATLLKDAGYHTYMAGKWHLGLTPETGPHQRGFERSFALLEGGASHFGDARYLLPRQSKASYRENGHEIELPRDFYSSRSYTDKLIEYIEANRRDGKPFFSYAAYTAPHWPLQAPDDYLDKYRGVYADGYDALRQKRLAGAKRAGVIPAEAELLPTPARTPLWRSLGAEEQRIEARKMEVYAAMVDNLDHHVGRLVQYLKEIGEYEDTMFIFMSDNGAEGSDIANMKTEAQWISRTFDVSYENMGRAGSYVYYGAGWAQAGGAPFRLYKSFTTEGGIRVPAFVTYPRLDSQGVSDSIVSVTDIVPTLLDVAGIEYYGGGDQANKSLPLSGKSMLPLLRADARNVHARDEAMGWELFGRRAIREGDWKMVWIGPPNGPGRWELFNIAADLGEAHDLADAHPQIVRKLLRRWEAYQEQNNIILPSRDRGYANPQH